MQPCLNRKWHTLTLWCLWWVQVEVHVAELADRPCCLFFSFWNKYVITCYVTRLWFVLHLVGSSFEFSTPLKMSSACSLKLFYSNGRLFDFQSMTGVEMPVKSIITLHIWLTLWILLFANCMSNPNCQRIWHKCT